MNDRKLIEEDLIALAIQRDEDVDTSDIPETVDFSLPRRGRYFFLNSRQYDIRAIANWCIDKADKEGRKIRTLWLNKIVYFIYERAIQDWNVLLSGARLEAWKHGPVFREIYFDEELGKNATLFRRFNADTRKMEVATEEFLQEDLDLFESVWRELGHKSGGELRNLSHAEGSPWHAVWVIGGHQSVGMQIDIGTILGNTAYRHGRQRNSD